MPRSILNWRQQVDEINSNFGFNLTWWDRLFGTYREQSRSGQDDMTIGIHHHTTRREVARLHGMRCCRSKANHDGAMSAHKSSPAIRGGVIRLAPNQAETKHSRLLRLATCTRAG